MKLQGLHKGQQTQIVIKTDTKITGNNNIDRQDTIQPLTHGLSARQYS